jgi:hypothetical protein
MYMVKRFDFVVLKTIRNVKWVSGPASRPASPKGLWSVVGGVGGTDVLLLAKDNTVIKIPASDVHKVGDYDLNKSIQWVRRIKNKGQLRRDPVGGDHG